MTSETGETGKAGIVVASEDASPMEKLVSRGGSHARMSLHSR